LNLERDDCCYSYVSVPHNVLNNTFCVPNGEQVTLNYYIINPHDNLINLTVTWFRSITEDTSVFEEISATSEEYIFRKFVSGGPYNFSSVINCSSELYIDTVSLTILRFTRHKNGYYWCQLSINNTLAQPSYRTHFSVGECNNITRLTNLSELQCAQHVATESDAGLITTYVSSGTPSVVSSTESPTIIPSVTQQERESNKPIIYVATESSTRLCSVTQQERKSDNPLTYTATKSDTESLTRSSLVTQQERDLESDKPIIYVTGSFSVLLLIALLGVLALAFSFAFYVNHQRKKTLSKWHRSTCYIIPDKSNLL
jgi:hypothetical protein